MAPPVQSKRAALANGPTNNLSRHDSAELHAPQLDDDADDVVDARAQFLGELLVEVYAQGRADERRRFRELASTTPTLRALHAELMRDAIGGER